MRVTAFTPINHSWNDECVRVLSHFSEPFSIKITIMIIYVCTWDNVKIYPKAVKSFMIDLLWAKFSKPSTIHTIIILLLAK